MKALVAEYSESLVAFRFHAHEGKQNYLDSFSDTNVRKLWRTAGEFGLIIKLHIGPDSAGQVAGLAREFPEFTVLVDHMAEAQYGSGPEFSDTIRLSELDNVYMKLSGLNHYATDELLFESVIPFSRCVVDSFGPDRMVLGSGSPEIVDTHLTHWSESDRGKSKATICSACSASRALGRRQVHQFLWRRHQ